MYLLQKKEMKNMHSLTWKEKFSGGTEAIFAGTQLTTVKLWLRIEGVYKA